LKRDTHIWELLTLLEFRRKNMAFPSDKELKKIRKLLENVEGMTVIGEEGTKLEKFKFAICQKMVGYFIASKMSQKEFSIFLGIDVH
jgi:hypothetical protein